MADYCRTHGLSSEPNSLVEFEVDGDTLKTEYWIQNKLSDHKIGAKGGPQELFIFDSSAQIYNSIKNLIPLSPYLKQAQSDAAATKEKLSIARKKEDHEQNKLKIEELNKELEKLTVLKNKGFEYTVTSIFSGSIFMFFPVLVVFLLFHKIFDTGFSFPIYAVTTAITGVIWLKNNDEKAINKKIKSCKSNLEALSKDY